MVKRLSKHFLISLSERKREALVGAEKDHQGKSLTSVLLVTTQVKQREERENRIFFFSF